MNPWILHFSDQYSSEADTEKFFTALGSGNRALVPEESAGGDDQVMIMSLTTDIGLVGRIL